MNAQEYQEKKDREYKEKLDKRMAEIKSYWEKNPRSAKIILSEESRAYLRAVSSGKKTGKDWDTLDQKIKDAHAEMVTDAIRKLRTIEPQAFVEALEKKPRKV